MSRLFLPNYDDLAKFGRDRGSGTSMPTTDLRRGDLYQHTSYGLHIYTGVAWRQRGPYEIASAQRTALDTSGLHVSYLVFETDTKITWQWDGSSWAALLAAPMAGQWSGPSNGANNVTTYAMPAVTPVFQQGGLNLGTISTGTFTLPNGLWAVDYSFNLVASGTLNGRSFVVFGGQRHPLGMVGEDFSGATFIYPVRGASASITVQFYVTATVSPFNSQHVLTLARIGAIA